MGLRDTQGGLRAIQGDGCMDGWMYTYCIDIQNFSPFFKASLLPKIGTTAFIKIAYYLRKKSSYGWREKCFYRFIQKKEPH